MKDLHNVIHLSIVFSKFDLIVSNILLSPLKKNTSEFCKHLISGGYIIISGILKTQINDIRSHYGKFNLKLVKSIYINKWASIIFKKYDWGVKPANFN